MKIWIRTPKRRTLTATRTPASKGEQSMDRRAGSKTEEPPKHLKKIKIKIKN